jgi:hypothetical protein
MTKESRVVKRVQKCGNGLIQILEFLRKTTTELWIAAEESSEHLTNTSLERYVWTNLYVVLQVKGLVYRAKTTGIESKQFP